MASIPIAYVDVRFSVHATEDLEKVIRAIHQILPDDYIDDIVFERNNLRGHYGNPIILFDTRIKKKKIVEALVQKLFSKLNKPDNERLLKEIDSHVEEGSLYLRLDKQAALQGELKLCIPDPVRVRIRFRKKKIQDIASICQELGMSE